MTNREVKISEYADKRYIDKVGNEYIVRNDGINMSATLRIYSDDDINGIDFLRMYIKDMYKNRLAFIYSNCILEPAPEDEPSGLYITRYFRLHW